MVRMRGLLFFAVATLLLGMGGAPKEPQISIEKPYAVLSGMFVGAASVFLQIDNTGGRDTLLSASIDLPGTVTELHDAKGSRMFRVDRIAVPARGTMYLQPGGRHIMIFNLPKKVQEGSELALKLRFERSGTREITVRFENAAGMLGGH